MKPWYVTLIVVSLAVVGLISWLVASYLKGRNGR